MKKLFFSVLVIILTLSLLLPILGVTAQIPTGDVASREEVVYANLTANGQVKGVYVVNTLNVVTPGLVTDHGSYTEAQNLTSTAPLTRVGNVITVEASSGRFYYQGNAANPVLPWKFDIEYRLDGQAQAPDALAGKDGRLEIKISTSPNTAYATFYDNYLLQISLTLDTTRFANIYAPGATVANAGHNKIVTYTVMPGRVGNIYTSADVANLALAAIEISAVPLSIQLALPDTQAMTNDLSALSQAIGALHQGATQLQGGTQELAQGAKTLAEGSEQFSQGLNGLSHNSGALVAGSAEIRQALNMIAGSLHGSPGQFSLGGLAALPSGLSQLAVALADISRGLSELKSGFAQAFVVLDTAIMTIPDWNISQDELYGLYIANPTQKGLLDKLVEYYTAGRTVRATYHETKPGFAAVEGSLSTVITSIDTVAGSLGSLSQQVSQGLESSESTMALMQLSQGLAALANDYGAFHSGLVAYTAGMTEVASSYSGLHGGVTGLSTGAAALHGGISRLQKGVGELEAGVMDLPQQVDKEIEKLIGQYDKSGYEPVSFVSAENSNTTAVQFVMRTEPIERRTMDKPPVVEKTKESFWTRLMNLFKR